MAKIFLSPSDQVKNKYAGSTASEADVCGSIAYHCERMLRRNGHTVLVCQYDTMPNKVKAANKFNADIYVPIHTNAFDGKVMGTRIFSYDTSGKGWQYANKIFDKLAPMTPGTSDNIKAAPTLYEVKMPAAPTVYVEVEFHDSIMGASWLEANVEIIGETLGEGICDALGLSYERRTPQQCVYCRLHGC